jgi:CHAD domain-containing protein
MAKPLKIKKVSPSDPIRLTAARILTTRIKEFYSHWPDPSQPPTMQELHNLRISGKRLRYSAECLRDLFPDRLTLLIEILKRSQDLLGEIQDCFTQKTMIAEDSKRLQRRHPLSPDLEPLNRIAADYDARQKTLLAEYREIWLGMRQKEFRKCLREMVKKC